MRKIIFAIIIVTLTASSAKSNIFFDVFGLYNNTGYAQNQSSIGPGSIPGFAGGVNFSKEFSLIIRGYKTSVVVNPNKDNEKNYSFSMTSGGFEYNLPILLYGIDRTLGWRSSVMIGYSRTDISKKDPVTLGKTDVTDKGPAFSISTGLQLILMQNLAIFMDAGYQKSYYIGNLDKKNIGGYQLMAGVRLYLFNFKDIGDNY